MKWTLNTSDDKDTQQQCKFIFTAAGHLSAYGGRRILSKLKTLDFPVSLKETCGGAGFELYSQNQQTGQTPQEQEQTDPCTHMSPCTLIHTACLEAPALFTCGTGVPEVEIFT